MKRVNVLTLLLLLACCAASIPGSNGQGFLTKLFGMLGGEHPAKPVDPPQVRERVITRVAAIRLLAAAAALEQAILHTITVGWAAQGQRHVEIALEGDVKMVYSIDLV
jgi:hypothetical protein